MMKRWLSLLKGFFSRGHQRSQKAKRNILYSIMLKGINIAIGFVQVPLLIHFIGDVKYGIWLTIGSVITWFSFLDIGLGNGMRNHLATALAKDEKTLGRKLVSSSYFAIGLVALGFFLLFAIVNYFLDWESIFRAPENLHIGLKWVLLAVFGLFCLRFVLKLVGTILTADQRPAVNNSFVPMGNVLSIVGILLAMQLAINGSIMLVGILLTGPVVVVYLFASIYFFSREYRFLRPSISFIDKTQINKLMGLGLKFFILQVGQIIIYTTDNMIITRILGPSEVTTYFIPHKYFSLITMGFSIIMVPMWSAFTEANAVNDFKWIKNTLSKLLKVWALFCVLAVVMLASSPWLYRLWVGQTIAMRVPLMLSVLSAVFVCISSFSSIYLNYLNGVGKVSLQLILIIVAAGINIPLSVYFGRNLEMGSTGVILASILSMSLFALLTPVQVWLLLRGKAKGIWNR